MAGFVSLNGALRILVGSSHAKGHPRRDEGVSSLRGDPTKPKHLRHHGPERGPSGQPWPEGRAGPSARPLWPEGRVDDRADSKRRQLSRMWRSGPGQRAAGGHLHRPPGSWGPDAPGLEEAPDAMAGPEVPEDDLGPPTTSSRPRTFCSPPGTPGARPSKWVRGGRARE